MPIPRSLTRVRALPWQVILSVGTQVVREGRKRWERLTPAEQRRLTTLVRASHGRLGNLTTHEREDLRRIVTKAVRLRG